MDVMAEFHGGPQDGRVMPVPDLRPRWLFPYLDQGCLLTFDAAYPTDPCRYLVYEVALDPAMGRPSLNDQGFYRYEYRGVR